jgi:hypothetical protein
MLNAHSTLAIPAESHFIVPMAQRREHFERPEGFAIGSFAEELIQDPRFRLWDLPPAHVREALADVEPTTLQDAFRTVFALYAEREGKLGYGDKTPGYVRELGLLAELFSEARFVHIIRDGRDVILSLLEMEWAREQAPEGFDRLARFWGNNVMRGMDAGRLLGPGRYHEVRYERLIDEPEPVLREVCEFLALAFEQQMLTYHEQLPTFARSLRRPQDHRRLALPPTRGLRDWRAELSGSDRRRFEQIAGEALERAGYATAV